MIERLLRAAAIGIAVAALLDPSLVMTARLRPRVTVTFERPGDSTSLQVGERLAGALRADFDVVPSGPDRNADAAIVIGERYPDRTNEFPARTSTVTVDAAPGRARVRIANVRAATAVPRGTKIQLEVTLDALAEGTSTSIVTATAGVVGQPDTEVARVEHTWTTATRRAVVRLDALPLGLPPWHLRVHVSDGGQPTIETNDVLVTESAPLRVLFYDPRPSWIGTFVRRSLEADTRFAIEGLTYPSRGVRITTGSGPSLDPIALRNVAAVVVGGLDQLTSVDRDRLDWFATERGGSVVLLPDARPGAEPWTQWLQNATMRERLLERPSPLTVAPPLPVIQASELVTFSRAKVLGATVPGATVPGATVPGATVPGATVPGATVLARVAGSNEPVVIMIPRGTGRVLVSGALDAWRYRADQGSMFDRFWRSTIAGVALATPPAVDVEFIPAIARPGSPVRILARVHRAALPTVTGPVPVSARLESGEAVRLWPDAEVDAFSGSFTAGQPGVQHVTVSVGAAETQEATVRTMLAVDPSARHAEPFVALALLAESHRGINVTPDRLADLVAYLRRDVTTSPSRTTTHPMRSGWWIVPFGACLSGEWWLRRRKGLR